MSQEYRNHFQEFCDRLSYNTVVFRLETHEVLGFHSQRSSFTDRPERAYLNIDYSTVPADRSLVFYGQNLVLDNRTLICSGSVNLISTGSKTLAVVFFEPRIANFRSNQLPRILWKNTDHLYLGQSEYVRVENGLTHTMVGYTDEQLFEKERREAFWSSDEAIFKNGTCFWDLMGKITVNGVTSLVKMEKFPYYSEEGQLLGAVLAYLPIQEAGWSSVTADSGSGADIAPVHQAIVNRLLRAANIFIAIQDQEGEPRITACSDNLVKIGYDIRDFSSGLVSLKDLIYPGDYDRFQHEIQKQLYERKETFWLTLRLLSRTQEILPAKLFFSPMVSPSGQITKIALLIDLYDVTEEVSMNYEKLFTAATKMHVVFAVRRMSCLTEFEILTGNIHQFGYQSEDFLQKRLNFLDLIHPDDRKPYREAMESVRSHKTMQAVVEYRIRSRKGQIYWLKETMFSHYLRGVEYLESGLYNITSTKAAFETLQEMNAKDNPDISFERISANFNFSSALKFADVRGQMENFSSVFGADCALFNNHDALMITTSKKPGAIDFLLKQFVDFTSFVAVDRVMSLFDNLYVEPFPVINGEHRIGTLLVYALTRDNAPAPGFRAYEDPNRFFKAIRFADAKLLSPVGRILSSSIATMVFSASVALMQIQSQRTSEIDLNRQRESHETLLDLLTLSSQSPDVEDAFRAIMPRVGEVLQLTRASLFLREVGSDDTFSLVHEWYADGESPRRGLFQHVRKEDTFFKGWDTETSVSFALNSDDVVEDKRHLREVVRAIVGVRLRIEGKLIGFINFVDNYTNRTWLPEDIILCEDVGYILSSVMERSQSKQLAFQTIREFRRALDSLPSAVAVLEKKTDVCRFANQRFWDLLPDRGEDGGERRPERLSSLIERLLAHYRDGRIENETYFPEVGKWFLIDTSDIHFEGDVESQLLILTDITANKKTQEAVQDMAFTDGLTGVPNRMRLEKELPALLAKSKDERSQSFMCLVNVDNFRTLNDAFGFATGDEVLRLIVKKMRQIPGMEDAVYRFGGDEFAVLLDQTRHMPIYDFASRLMGIFEHPFLIGEFETACTVSMGMVCLSDADEGIDDLLRKANLSLKDAKDSGKNRFVLFDASLRKYEEDTGALERALKVAIDEGFGEFRVFYQPIVSATTGKIVSAEALIRWFSPDFGLVSPVKFIPIAETSGLIVPLGKHILNTACQEVKKWLDYGIDVNISVNFSVIQTLQSDLVATIQKALDTYRIPAKNLIFEITESLAIHDINKVIDILSAVRDIGVRIAMDDFGTGYSSLNHLRKLPLDIVKIDRSFIFNIEYDPYTVAFVDTIAKFCHMKNTALCAEGVETETQKAMLQSVNVDTLQGYLFGKPCAADEFWKLLLDNK